MHRAPRKKDKIPTDRIVSPQSRVIVIPRALQNLCPPPTSSLLLPPQCQPRQAPPRTHQHLTSVRAHPFNPPATTACASSPSPSPPCSSNSWSSAGFPPSS